MKFKYYIYARSYNKNNEPDDFEEFLGAMDSKEDAIEHANHFTTLGHIYEEDVLEEFVQGDYAMVSVSDANGMVVWERRVSF